MNTPRKPFRWKGRAWVRRTYLPHAVLWKQRSAWANVQVEVTIREVGKRGKK